MSQYTQLFIRKGDTLIELDAYSRSNKIAQAFSPYAPWEKIAPVSMDDLMSIQSELRDKINDYKDMLVTNGKRANEIGQWNNTVEEKQEALASLDEYSSELRDELSEYEYAENVVTFLMSVVDNGYGVQRFQYNVPEDQIVPVLYAGTEVSSNATLDMVQK